MVSMVIIYLLCMLVAAVTVSMDLSFAAIATALLGSVASVSTDLSDVVTANASAATVDAATINITAIMVTI